MSGAGGDAGTPGRDPEAGDRERAPSLLARALGTLTVPAAPLYGALLAYTIYHPPRRRRPRCPGDLDLPSRDLTVPVPGGGPELRAWLIPGPADRVVVVGHGLGRSRASSLAHARFLHAAGHTVCLFDHRNHGTSGHDGAVWNLGDRFTDDVDAVIAHLRAMDCYAGSRFAVYGFSFSAFPVVNVLGRPGCALDAVVCDSGPGVRIKRLFDNFFDADVLPLPRPLRAGPARAVVRWACSSMATAMLRDEWPPPAEGAYTRTPMLFLAGEEDVIVPPQEVAALASAYPRSEVHVLPRTGHLAGVKTDAARYEAIVLEFLGRALAPAGTPLR